MALVREATIDGDLRYRHRRAGEKFARPTLPHPSDAVRDRFTVGLPEASGQIHRMHAFADGKFARRDTLSKGVENTLANPFKPCRRRPPARTVQAVKQADDLNSPVVYLAGIACSCRLRNAKELPAHRGPWRPSPLECPALEVQVGSLDFQGNKMNALAIEVVCMLGARRLHAYIPWSSLDTSGTDNLVKTAGQNDCYLQGVMRVLFHVLVRRINNLARSDSVNFAKAEFLGWIRTLYSHGTYAKSLPSIALIAAAGEPADCTS